MAPILAMGFGGPYDMAILGGVIILLFGGAKIAGFGRSVGQGIRDFKRAAGEEEDASGQPPRPNSSATASSVPASGTATDKSINV